MRFDPRLSHAWWTLRIGLGLAPLLAGLDKYFNRLTNWEMYLNPLIPRLLHVSAPTFMHLVGVVEIAAGLLVFTRFTRYAAYVVMAWLFVLLRVAHAYVHTTSNYVPTRFRIFAASVFVLLIMWIIFAVRILLALP